jgi:stress response protein YsnF
VEVYEETPEIRKEAFVREEVRVKKVVEQDTVNAEETLRREELDVRTEGEPTVNRPERLPTDRV